MLRPLWTINFQTGLIPEMNIRFIVLYSVLARENITCKRPAAPDS